MHGEGGEEAFSELFFECFFHHLGATLELECEGAFIGFNGYFLGQNDDEDDSDGCEFDALELLLFVTRALKEAEKKGLRIAADYSDMNLIVEPNGDLWVGYRSPDNYGKDAKDIPSEILEDSYAH